MNVGIVGAGWVGLVTAAGLASTGNRIVAYDINQDRIRQLNRQQLPVYEPGLADLLHQHPVEYTSDVRQLSDSHVVFLTVGTPPNPDGTVNLTHINQAATELIPHMRPGSILAVKSTVPPGTTRRLSTLAHTIVDQPPHVLSNPEFLAEGRAVTDFLRPARIVIGTDSPDAASQMVDLYRPFARRTGNILVTTPESAELAKYAANVFLATKVSFINEVANLCDLYGANIDDVRHTLILDPRIGDQFLYPGLGYGGSCFPKDVTAAITTAQQAGYQFRIAEAAHTTNQHQTDRFLNQIQHRFGPLAGTTVTLWGTAFKPATSDIRESRGIRLARQLTNLKVAALNIYDPHALEPTRRLLGTRNITYSLDPYQTASDSDLLIVATEHPEIRSVDLTRIHKTMRRPAVADGRNVYLPDEMAALGFDYLSVGRPSNRIEPLG